MPIQFVPPKDFTIQQDASNGLRLSIRYQEWSIASPEDELTEADIELFQKIEKLLNDHAAELLPNDFTF